VLLYRFSKSIQQEKSMHVPVAQFVKGESERLAQSALHNAPVVEAPSRQRRTEVGRVRRGTAAALRRGADLIAPRP
jgi:hypothetical protein